MKRTIDVYDLGRKSYSDAWEIQKNTQKLLVQQKRTAKGSVKKSDYLNDQFFFTEHPHVYTLGKSGKSSNLLKSLSELASIDAEYIEIDRGGDITYHGPGQIVGYPIIDLEEYFTDIHRYLRYLEEVIIQTCSEFDIKGDRIEGLTGVWVKGEKICAMGLHCSRWVTMHGFALNVNTDLSYFNHIVPCGIEGKNVTSLEKILGEKIKPDVVKSIIINKFSEVFDVEIQNHDEYLLSDKELQ
jgi:lipoyl(octanoyl) transferase